MSIFFITVLKTDYLLGELNGHLDTFKVFHIITYNAKFLHKLNEKNYKRLAILSRIIIIIMINYVTTFFSILVPLVILIIAILSKQLYVFIHFILFTIPYISAFVTLFSSGAHAYIYFQGCQIPKVPNPDIIDI